MGQALRVNDPSRVEVGRLDPAEWLGRRVHVMVDRPRGSTHPAGGFRYEVDYGFVPGLFAPDGEELDAYVLGSDEPLTECEGEVIAVVVRADDNEDKLVVGLTGPCPREQIEAAIRFQEQFFDSTVVTEA